MNATPPLDWIKTIDSTLAALDEKPQFGFSLPLDWGQMERELQQLFNRPNLKIKHEEKGWIEGRLHFAGLGGDLRALCIEWAPLESPLYFVTSQTNLKALMTDFFETAEAAQFFYDSHLIQGFYNYFAAEILRVLHKQQFGFPLSPRLGPHPEHINTIENEPCFAIDLSLVFNQKSFWGRVLIPAPFRSCWKSYFMNETPPEPSLERQQKVFVDVAVEVGHTSLLLQEWKQVKNGDCIILDQCSYDFENHKGGVLLTLDQKPLFLGRIKEGGIKIIHHSIYEEADNTMAKEPVEQRFSSDDDDEDLYGDLDDDDSDFGEEEDEEDDLFSSMEEEEDEKDEEDLPEVEEKVVSESGPQAEEQTPIAAEDLPIHLTVEVMRVRMSIGELLQLTPGNLIELNVAPEKGVDLVVNGKKVGRGELVRIGEVLGVRIVSL